MVLGHNDLLSHRNNVIASFVGLKNSCGHNQIMAIRGANPRPY